jgi:putative transposase
LQVFAELKNRGVTDVLIAVCDGLKGLPEAITTTWQHTVVQQCIVHLIRNSFRYAGRQHRDAIAKALRPIYTAPSEAAAKERFTEFADQWGARYPAIVRLWGERLGRVRAVPRVRRRNPPGHLHHQRDRVGQRPIPARGQGKGPLPDRAGCDEVPLPRHQIP